MWILHYHSTITPFTYLIWVIESVRHFFYQTICILLNSLFSIPTYYFKLMFYYNFLPKIYLEMLH